MSSVAALLFITATAAAGIYVGTQKTVIKGEVIASEMMEKVGGKGITSIQCDPEIPVTAAGAVFHCAVVANDGSTASFEYTMKRSGELGFKLLESTPSRPRAPARPGTDSWGD